MEKLSNHIASLFNAICGFAAAQCGKASPFRQPGSTLLAEACASPHAGRMPVRLLHPIRDEDIRFAPDFSIPIRCEDQFPAIGREHGEAVESIVEGNSLDTRAVHVNLVEIEIASLWIGHV